MSRVLHCYASGRDGNWEAICLDLDIAVQGRSFTEVNDDLMKAVRLHLERVLEMPPEEQGGLLRRPVPLLVRLRFAIEAFLLALSQRDSGTYQHQYTVAAPA
jgi:hypothetical protein